MQLFYTYLVLILIWSTTPLAIQWSNQGSGPLLSIILRMLIGSAICLAVLFSMRQKLVWTRQSLLAYASAGLGIAGAMSCVYWGAEYIPSGLIAVLFGLTPLFTAVLAHLLLAEKSLTLKYLSGILLSLTGLLVIFHSDLHGYPHWHKGLSLLLLSVLLHSTSAVLTRKYSERLSALTVTTGGLALSSVLLVLAWVLLGMPLPVSLPTRTTLSILYLGIIGSGLGFLLYFHALNKTGASRLALITLITPITGLLVGAALNHEPLTRHILLGTLLTLTGLGVSLLKFGRRRPCAEKS